MSILNNFPKNEIPSNFTIPKLQNILYMANNFLDFFPLTSTEVSVRVKNGVNIKKTAWQKKITIIFRIVFVCFKIRVNNRFWIIDTSGLCLAAADSFDRSLSNIWNFDSFISISSFGIKWDNRSRSDRRNWGKIIFQIVLFVNIPENNGGENNRENNTKYCAAA